MVNKLDIDKKWWQRRWQRRWLRKGWDERPGNAVAPNPMQGELPLFWLVVFPKWSICDIRWAKHHTGNIEQMRQNGKLVKTCLTLHVWHFQNSRPQNHTKICIEKDKNRKCGICNPEGDFIKNIQNAWIRFPKQHDESVPRKMWKTSDVSKYFFHLKWLNMRVRFEEVIACTYL